MIDFLEFRCITGSLMLCSYCLGLDFTDSY